MSEPTITLTHEDLDELLGEIERLTDMMEPYYSQNGCADEPLELVRKWRDELPHREEVRPVLGCPMCPKITRGDVRGLREHLLHKHGVVLPDSMAKIINKALRPRVREWERRGDRPRDFDTEPVYRPPVGALEKPDPFTMAVLMAPRRRGWPGAR